MFHYRNDKKNKVTNLHIFFLNRKKKKRKENPSNILNWKGLFVFKLYSLHPTSKV